MITLLKNAGLFQPMFGSNMDIQTKPKPNGWVCPYWTQTCVNTSQHFSFYKWVMRFPRDFYICIIVCLAH